MLWKKASYIVNVLTFHLYSGEQNIISTSSVWNTSGYKSSKMSENFACFFPWRSVGCTFIVHNLINGRSSGPQYFSKSSDCFFCINFSCLAGPERRHRQRFMIYRLLAVLSGLPSRLKRRFRLPWVICSKPGLPVWICFSLCKPPFLSCNLLLLRFAFSLLGLCALRCGCCLILVRANCLYRLCRCLSSLFFSCLWARH